MGFKQVVGYRLRLALDYVSRSRPVGTRLHPWEPVFARRRSSRSKRDPFTYESVIDQFAVRTNLRYLKNRNGRGETYCNIFVWDVTRAMGAEIPHWLGADGSPTTTGRGRELTANDAIEWLRSHGPRFGWRAVDRSGAQAHANRGCPAIAAWLNPGGIGHIAVVRPGVLGEDGPIVAQAGETNEREVETARAFRSAWLSGEVVYFAHD